MRIRSFDFSSGSVVVEHDGRNVTVPLGSKDTDTVHANIVDAVGFCLASRVVDDDGTRRARIAVLQDAHRATESKHYDHQQGRALEQLALQAELEPLAAAQDLDDVVAAIVKEG